MTASQVYDEVIGVDQVTVNKGVYTARRGFYYTGGATAEGLVNRIKAAFPQAVIIDSCEVWLPFRGGASVAKQSHWFVKFTLGEKK